MNKIFPSETLLHQYLLAKILTSKYTNFTEADKLALYVVDTSFYRLDFFSQLFGFELDL